MISKKVNSWEGEQTRFQATKIGISIESNRETLSILTLRKSQKTGDCGNGNITNSVILSRTEPEWRASQLACC